MDEPITKRLIISGLTPAISAEDISRRLTSFGTVKAADGFGLPDGLGQPRKFGYVTLETTVGKLSKCMNLLSGSTWKGAKLRFGEAKPDFSERIAMENQKAAEEPPKKKVKWNVGVHAEDMSLVTPESVAQKPGWKVSSLGRITVPVKLRPLHPLIEPLEAKAKKPKKTKIDEKVPKKKKRVKDPDTRARRKAIDMTKYGSTHLKGMWLDLEVSGSSRKSPPRETEPTDSSSSSSSDESEAEAPAAVPAPDPSPPPPIAEAVAITSNIPPLHVLKPPQTPEETVDISQEKTQALNLLNSLFGQDDDDDWVGRESVGSDIDVDELVKGDKMLVDHDYGVDFEVVPKNAPAVKVTNPHEGDEEEEVNENEDENNNNISSSSSSSKMDTVGDSAQSLKVPQKTTLKDLFAPREDEGGFSLLGHLDLDIELDENAPFLGEEPMVQQQAYESHAPSIPVPQSLHGFQQSQNIQTPLSLNPRQALFFPLSITESAGVRARQRDVYDIAKDNGWNWRDPAVRFYRTGTDEDIKKRWEETKGDLTRDWKRRCREAGKVNRRKKGGVEDAEL